jgi:ABC-type polysaccharide/polyol phosphate export permease
MLNPMAGLIDSYRQVLLFGQQPSLIYLGLSSLVALVVYLAGYRLFKRLERTFPDVI